VQLFSALFSGSLSRAWAQAVERARAKDGLTIVIRSSSMPVQALPWELLSDPTLTSSEFVAIAEGWSVVRDVHLPREHDAHVRTLRPHEPGELDILALTTPVPGLEQSDDPRILQAAFTDSKIRSERDASARTILDALAWGGHDLLHVVGTGRRGRQGIQDLVVAFEDPSQAIAIPSQDLSAAAAKAAEGGSPLDLLVLAACETDLLAAQLARSIAVVIGIRGIITNDGCEAFLQGLYRALASGATVTQAVAAGRAQQVTFSRALGEEWAQPVVFLSTDAPLVARTSAGDEAAPPIPVPSPQVTAEQRRQQLHLEIKQANLRALQDQWGQVDDKDVPTVVTRQLTRLDQEVQDLEGGGT
jgi:hypothetical protein